MTILTSLGARASKGFTLAELLIALAILGVIATFTIPKILSSSQNGQNTSIAKEVGAMVNAAYQNYTLDNGIASGVTGGAITTYMNYVAVDTATALSTATSGTALQTCASTLPCLKLHNGAVLQYDTAQTFGGTNGAASIYFNLDPDGTGPQGRISFVQFATGRLSTGGVTAATPGTAGTITRQATDPAYLTNWN
jgi:prepilin-type N-terminal cleavage/methylation domain-containing protein